MKGTSLSGLSVLLAISAIALKKTKKLMPVAPQLLA